MPPEHNPADDQPIDREAWESWESEQEQIRIAAEELAEAISPCCVCGLEIAWTDTVTKHGDLYRHATCEPKEQP